MQTGALFVFVMGFAFTGTAQEKDSLSIRIDHRDSIYFSLTRITSDKQYTLVKVSGVNFSKSPSCLLHSRSIIPNQVLPPFLVKQSETDSAILYSITHTEYENRFDDMPTDWNIFGYILLPLQDFSFEILVPNSIKRQLLSIRYFRLADFCYSELMGIIQNDSKGWHRNFLTRQLVLDIPK